MDSTPGGEINRSHIHEKYFWHDMRADVRSWLVQCRVCVQAKGLSGRTRKNPMIIVRSGHPLRGLPSICMDHCRRQPEETRRSWSSQPERAPVSQRARVPQRAPVPQIVWVPQRAPVSQRARVPPRARVPQRAPVPQIAPVPHIV